MSHRYYTKADWIEMLEKQRDQWAAISSAQSWLYSRLKSDCNDIEPDREISGDMLVQLIHREALKEVAGRSPEEYFIDRPLYVDYLNATAHEAQVALLFAHDLTEVCAHIGGQELGKMVRDHVFAVPNMVKFCVSEFLLNVYVPLYPRITHELDCADSVNISIGNQTIRVMPLFAGRAHLTIMGFEHSGDDSASIEIYLSGEDIDPDKASLSPRYVAASSVETILSMFRNLTDTFKSSDIEHILIKAVV